MNTNPQLSDNAPLTSPVKRAASGLRLRFFHPVNSRYHGEGAPSGIRLANLITGFMGSWTFLILQTIFVAAWIALNIAAWFKHFDPYPFILLNLAFSTQAAYAAPLILMAGNVAAAKDRELWDNDYATNQKAYEKIESMEVQIELLVESNNQLLKILAKEQIPVAASNAAASTE